MTKNWIKIFESEKEVYFDEDVQLRNAFQIFAVLEKKIEYGD